MALSSNASHAEVDEVVADAHALAVAALANVGDVQGHRIKELDDRARELKTEQRRVAKTRKSEKEKRQRLLKNVNK